MLAQWLVGSGHTPEQADKWLSRFPAWWATDPVVMDYVASSNAAKWSAKARLANERWVRDLADWTGAWAAYRRKE